MKLKKRFHFNMPKKDKADFLIVKNILSGLRHHVQKPEALTTFGQSDCINNIYLEIKDLTPAIDGQYFPAVRGQGHWIFQNIKESVNLMDILLLDNLIVIPEGANYNMTDEGILQVMKYFVKY